MFNKQSRYYKLKNQAIENQDGFVIDNKQLRVLPEVDGKVFYKLDAGDRIDHLAYKFFGRAKQWWHICDANPDFFSPRELLGETPIKHQSVSVSFLGYAPQWTDLFGRLKHLLGIQAILSDNLPTKDVSYSTLNFLATLVDTSVPLLDESVRVQSIPAALVAAFVAAGIILESRVRISKPNDSLWHIDDINNQVIYTCVFIDNDAPDPDVIEVYQATILYSRVVEIEFNTNSIDLETILSEIQVVGFDVDWHESIGRVGKKIMVPTKYAG